VRKLKTINIPDLPLSFIQDNVENFTRQLQQKPIIEGRHIRKISLLKNTDKVINHGLGRDLLGWHVTDKNVSADIFRSATVNQAPHNTIILQANADVMIDLWVF
jgi:hypothetical protein